jgi:hypothetical protein
MQFMFEMLLFTVGEDDDLEHPAQEQEERRTTTIGFEFPRGLKNSATTFQAAVRAWGSPLGHHPETDLFADPISGPTLTASFQLRRYFNNQLRQIRSTVRHDHRSGLHR